MTQPKRNIVWIVSYPKSGNTWFRLFLSSILNPEKEIIDINNFDSVFIASDRNIFDRISGTNSSDLTLDEINNIRPNIYRMISSANQNTLYIKVHDAWQKNRTNDELFPSEITKKVLLIVRNPMDLAVSLSNHHGISIKKAVEQINSPNFCLAGNPNKMPAQLYQYLGSWSEHYRSWVERSGLDIYVLKYEDMLLDPLRYFSDALDFLEIKTNNNHILSSIRKCSFETLQEQEKEFGFNEKPIRSKMFFKTGRMHYWKDFLDKDDIHSLKTTHAEIINRLNYS